MRRSLRLLAALGVVVATAASPDAVAKDRKARKRAVEPHSEEGPASRAPRVSPEAELQEIVATLSATHQKAMEDPEIVRAQSALQARVDQAIAKEDPGFDRKLARLEEIVTQLDVKLAQGAEVTPLVQEGQRLQRELEAIQSKVMAAEPLASEIASFDARVQAKMTEIEPRTPALMERANALLERIGEGAPSS